MSQQIFVPYAGQFGVPMSRFLGNLSSDTGFVSYGVSTGADAFLSDQFTVGVAFRVLRENPDDTTFLTCTDSGQDPRSWSLGVGTANNPQFLNSAQGVVATVTGGGDTVQWGSYTTGPVSGALPVGRILLASFSFNSIVNPNGLLMVNGSTFDNANNVVAYDTTPPSGAVSITFGPGVGATPSQYDYEFLGFYFIGARMNYLSHDTIYVATQDAGRVVVPAGTPDGAPYAVYNALTGPVLPLGAWTPDDGDIAIDLLRTDSEVNAPVPRYTVAPAHWAHSGWFYETVAP